MKVVKLKIGYVGSVKNNFKYIAEAIEDENRYYYRVDDVTIEITQSEYNYVIINPYLYYFSTALKLHYLIQKNHNRIRSLIKYILSK